MIKVLLYKDAAIEDLLIEDVADGDLFRILEAEDHNDENLYKEHSCEDQVAALKEMTELQQYEDSFLTDLLDSMKIAITSMIQRLLIVKQWTSDQSINGVIATKKNYVVVYNQILEIQ